MRVDFLRPLAAILRFPKLQLCLKRSSNPFPGRIRWEGPPLCRAVWRAAHWRWNGLTQGDTKLLNEFDLTRIQIDAGLYQWEALPHLPPAPTDLFRETAGTVTGGSEWIKYSLLRTQEEGEEPFLAPSPSRVATCVAFKIGVPTGIRTPEMNFTFYDRK